MFDGFFCLGIPGRYAPETATPLPIHFQLAHYRDADPDFAARLTSELPGIAAWMVRGLAAYMRAGQSLGPLPAAVAAASNQWAQDQDPVAQWMSEAGEVGRSFEETHGELYASYRAWCERAGHNRPYLSSIALGRALRQQQHDDGRPLFGERNRPELVWTELRLRRRGAPA